MVRLILYRWKWNTQAPCTSTYYVGCLRPSVWVYVGPKSTMWGETPILGKGNSVSSISLRILYLVPTSSIT